MPSTTAAARGAGDRQLASLWRGHDGRLRADWIASNLQVALSLTTGFLGVRLLAQNAPRAEYGFWMIAAAAGGYLLTVQRAAGAALMRAVAAGWACGDREQMDRSLRLLLSLLTIYATSGVVGGIFAARVFGAVYGPGVTALAFWSVFSVAGSMMLGGVNAALGGLGWFAAGRIFLMAAATANLLLIAGYAHAPFPLWELAALQAGATLLLAFFAFGAALVRTAELRTRTYRLAGPRETLHLLYSGAGFLLTDFGFMIAYQSDSILIGALLGPAQVVPLVLLQRIAGALQTVMGAQNAPLLPSMMSLHATGSLAGIRALYLTQLRRFSGPIIVFAWLIGCCGRDVVALWVGPALYAGWAVNIWIAIAFLVTSLYRPTGLTLCAIGEERRCGLFAISEAMVNVLLSILLIRRFGVPGTVMATVIAQIAVTHVPLLALLCRRLRLPIRSGLKTVLSPWAPAGLLLAGATILVLLGPDSLIWRGSIAGVATAGSLFSGWRRGWAQLPIEPDSASA